jgi:hypothetical protein
LLLQSLETQTGGSFAVTRWDPHPHEVTPYFRGSNPASVSPYWLDDPDLYFPLPFKRRGVLFGFPTDRLAAPPKLRDTSHVVAPSSGYNRSGLPAYHPAPGRTAHQQLSWSFAPLRRLSLSESTKPRFASPGTFRPQGLSPSRRIAPRPDARPYFRPVTPLGFHSPGVFPHRQVPPARHRYGIALVVFFPLTALT